MSGAPELLLGNGQVGALLRGSPAALKFAAFHPALFREQDPSTGPPSLENPFGVRPLCELAFELPHAEQAEDFEAKLELESGVVEIGFSVSGNRHRLRAFAPRKGHALLAELSATSPIDGVLRLSAAGGLEASARIEPTSDGLVLHGGLESNLECAAALAVDAAPGGFEPSAAALRFENAQSVTLVLALSVQYQGDALRSARAFAASAPDAAEFQARLAASSAEHEGLYLRLGSGYFSAPAASQGPFQRLFDYARYWLLCSGLPADGKKG